MSTNTNNEVERSQSLVPKVICEYCGGPIAIRNPTGKCDHLYYPDNINKKAIIKATRES